ncbi:molybdopterin adenylyltransferase [Candidatus Methanoperedens nitroreducens]|uniref:Molybdopterin adenylyltransferase n=1 Tax=Candidatus Methanoperedens nitratireducens TaxID=1392998 RepID=A0A062V6Q4_9EURY|nr:MogA/MoaB family molybdenum cofactor biosynthesis protein [Candidatus Methanoperedens nitroreducens]KCZ72967.1 molybdopterin adenylyltransferase [Candidatus Methanoperedens nitroreducens]MDJ1423090.1 MogA/MoaB family molybdenum cofactor biosynthesis protein [Candidatus Methanoperedens sp.]
MDMSLPHKENVPRSYKCAILTISTSRYEKYGRVDRPERAEDASGKLIWGMIQVQGCTVVHYELISDSIEMIKEALKRCLYSEADVIISSGGTGLTPADVTIEAVMPFLEKEMPGFGELFRYKSIEQIGNAVILTRAIAGVARQKAIFCLPGSPNAVKLALELVLPEMGHILKHVKGQ